MSKALDILTSLQTRLTVVMPVNHEPDSIEQICVITGALENRCDYVVVRNQVHSEHFSLYDSSRIRKRLSDELGPIRPTSACGSYCYHRAKNAHCGPDCEPQRNHNGFRGHR